MARKLTFQARALLMMGGLLALWWLLPFAVKSFLRTGFLEFQAPSWTAASHLRDLQDYWIGRTRSKTSLIEAGIDLARLNAAYELRLQEARLLSSEVARLEALLDLPRLPEHRYEVARVIRRDMTAWWQRIVIRKGSRDGIREGQAVVYTGGVVGRVVAVHLFTAEVELLTSPYFRVAAHLEGDLRPIQFQGGENVPLLEPRARISNVPPDIRVGASGAIRVVSSRLGGVFPDGLHLGQADRLMMDTDGLFQTGSVRIDTELLTVREVAVLIPLASPEEDAR